MKHVYPCSLLSLGSQMSPSRIPRVSKRSVVSLEEGGSWAQPQLPASPKASPCWMIQINFQRNSVHVKKQPTQFYTGYNPTRGIFQPHPFQLPEPEFQSFPEAGFHNESSSHPASPDGKACSSFGSTLPTIFLFEKGHSQSPGAQATKPGYIFGIFLSLASPLFILSPSPEYFISKISYKPSTSLLHCHDTSLGHHHLPLKWITHQCLSSHTVPFQSILHTVARATQTESDHMIPLLKTFQWY